MTRRRALSAVGASLGWCVAVGGIQGCGNAGTVIDAGSGDKASEKYRDLHPEEFATKKKVSKGRRKGG
jgi:hypothetical protein